MTNDKELDLQTTLDAIGEVIVTAKARNLKPSSLCFTIWVLLTSTLLWHGIVPKQRLLKSVDSHAITCEEVE